MIEIPKAKFLELLAQTDDDCSLRISRSGLDIMQGQELVGHLSFVEQRLYLFDDLDPYAVQDRPAEGH